MVSKREKIYTDLGDELKGFREKAGFTQAEAAKKAGVSANYYARVERGEENPTLSTIHKIVKALGEDHITIRY